MFDLNPTPPVAARLPKTDVVHGDTRIDDYFWLRDKGAPEVTAYLEAENAYTDAVMSPTRNLETALYDEIRGRVQETDLSVPYRDGDYLYYTRTEEGKQYPIHCRKPIAPGSMGSDGSTGAEQITLDLNVLAEGKPFLSLGVFRVSDDGKRLAFSTDETGFREYTLRIKDLATGELLSDTIARVDHAEWAADNQTLFVITEDDAKRSYRLYRHTLGTDAGDDVVVYEELDALFGVFARRSLDRTYLFFGSESFTETEGYFLRSDDPTGTANLIRRRELNVEYYSEHRDGLLYLRTNHDAVNFRLVTAPVENPGVWTELIAHRPGVMLEDHDCFARHLVLTERVDGLPRLRILRVVRFPDGTIEDADNHDITFPEPTYATSGDTNRVFDTDTFRFRYGSLITPTSIFDYDMNTRARTLLKETPVRGGYDRREYVSEYRHAIAADGTRIPISLVRRRDTPVDGSAPALLYGYGSYGISMPALFSANRLSLIDRGFVFAMAHIRGGGELGKPWHDDGKMMQKWNTFDDFIACAEYLIEEKLTSPDRLAIQGGSAGGLLMGAVVNKRPELFHAVLSIVPFVDVINTMLDDTLPLTIGEYIEWGNPQIAADYAYMKTYCPYTNLKAERFPTTLVRTSLNDSQVMYWEPAKYVAKLRTLKTNAEAPLLFHINMAAGHGGSSGRYDVMREVAFDYAFLLTAMGK